MTGPSSPSLPSLGIVVVSWNTRDLLRACLLSLRRNPPSVRWKVLVVDNASSDGTAAMVRTEFPEAQLVEADRNLGFSAGNNLGLAMTDADWILLLNPDTEVLPGALDRALQTGSECKTAVAARLLNPDGSLQPSTFRFPGLGRDLAQALWFPRLLPPGVRGRVYLGGYWDHAEAREVEWALGAFLLVPLEGVEAAGLLPEDYPLFGEDLEWCMRLREAGYPIRYVPEARVIHHGNQAAGQLPPPWRILRTHAATARFVRDRRGPLAAWLHGWILRLNYFLRALLFTLLGVFSSPRRAQGAEYRLILKTLLFPPEEVS